MNPAFSKMELRHLLKESLGPAFDESPTTDVGILADEDFLLRWSDGELTEQEHEQLLERLHRDPASILAVSEMISSGLLTLPSHGRRFDAEKIKVAVHGISTRKERDGCRRRDVKSKITSRQEAEAGSAEKEREEN